MASYGIPMDKAELLGTILESILYGIALFMFMVSIWLLLSKRASNPVNRGMFLIAILLILLSTAHVAVHIVRVMYGLVWYRDTYPEGPVGYFTNAAEWTLYVKNRIYMLQTLLGDAVIIFRCYVIWRSILITMFPVLLWCAMAVTGFVATVIEQNSPGQFVFNGPLKKWITACWTVTLGTSAVATLLLIFRIWNTDRKVKREGISHSTQLRQVLRITIDAGAIYSLTVLIGIICFLFQSAGQNVVLDMITPLIAMMFYMVIIRVSLITRDTRGSLSTTTMGDPSLDQRQGVQVCITTMTERKVDRHGRSSSCVMDTVDFDETVGSSEIQSTRKEEEVV